jgi:hypothetical protein
MAEFVKVFDMQGFDRHRAPQWQMVPWVGTRYVALRDGAGLAVTSMNPTIVTALEVPLSSVPTTDRLPLQPNDRVFMLLGVSRGNTKVRATGGPGAVDLEVGVKARKNVRISFNFVRDGAGHKTKRVPAQAAEWVKTLNYVFEGQANTKIILAQSRWVNVAANLGRRITSNKAGVGEQAHLFPLGDSGADVNMFLVWDLDITGNADDEQAFAQGSNIVFRDDAGRQIRETMSHELGHALGLPDQYTRRREIMYGYTDDRGAHLGKTDVNLISP